MSFDVMWDIDKYKEEHESEDHWMLRRNFMERWKESYPEERLVCLARVFANIEFMGCKYPLEVMQEVARMSKEVNIGITHSTKIASTPSYHRYFGGKGDSPNSIKRPASISRPIKTCFKKTNEFYEELSRSDQNYTIHNNSSSHLECLRAGTGTASVSEQANNLKLIDMSSNYISFSDCCLSSPDATVDFQNSSVGTPIFEEVSLDPGFEISNNKNSEVSILISDDENSKDAEPENTYIIQDGIKCMRGRHHSMRMWYAKNWVGDESVHIDFDQSLHIVKQSLAYEDRSYGLIENESSSSDDSTSQGSMGIEDQVYYTIIGANTVPLGKYYWRKLKDRNINNTILKKKYSSFWLVESESSHQNMDTDDIKTSRSIDSNSYIWAKYETKIRSEETDHLICDSSLNVPQIPFVTMKEKSQKNNKNLKTHWHSGMDLDAVLMDFFNRQAQTLPTKYRDRKISKKKLRKIRSWMELGASKDEALILCYSRFKSKNDEMVKMLKLRKWQRRNKGITSSRYGISSVALHLNSKFLQHAKTFHQTAKHPEKSLSQTTQLAEIVLCPNPVQTQESLNQTTELYSEKVEKTFKQTPEQPEKLSIKIVEQAEKSCHQIPKQSSCQIPEQRLGKLIDKSSSPIPEKTLVTDRQNREHREKSFIKIAEQAGQLKQNSISLCQVPRLASISLSFILQQVEKSSRQICEKNQDEKLLFQVPKLAGKSLNDIVVQQMKTCYPTLEEEQHVKSLFQVPKLADISLSVILEQAEKPCHQIKKQSSRIPKQRQRKPTEKTFRAIPEKTPESGCETPEYIEKSIINNLEQTETSNEEAKSLGRVPNLADDALGIIEKQAEKISTPIYEQTDKPTSQILQQSKERTKEKLKQSSDSLYEIPLRVDRLSTQLLESITRTAYTQCTDTIVISDDEDLKISRSNTVYHGMMNTIEERKELRYYGNKGESQSHGSHGITNFTQRQSFLLRTARKKLKKHKAELKYNQLRACIKDIDKNMCSKHAKILRDAIVQCINDEKIRLLRFLARSDCLVIICADKISRDWLDKVVPSLRPWPRAHLVIVKDHPPPVTTKAFIPFVPDFFDSHLQSYDLLDKLHEQNRDIGCDKWEVFKSETAIDGQRLMLLFDYQTDVLLQALNYRLSWASKHVRIKIVSKKPMNLLESALSPPIIDLCNDNSTTYIVCNNEPIQTTCSETNESHIPFSKKSTSLNNMLKNNNVRMSETTPISHINIEMVHSTALGMGYAPVGTSQLLTPPDNLTEPYFPSAQVIALSKPTNSLHIEQVNPSSLVSENDKTQNSCIDIFDENITTEELLIRFGKNLYKNQNENLQSSRRGTRLLFWTKLGATKEEAHIITQTTFNNTEEHNEMVKRIIKLAKKRSKINRQNKSQGKQLCLQNEGGNSIAAKRARLRLHNQKDQELRQLRVCIKDANKDVPPEEFARLQQIILQRIDNKLINFRFSTEVGCLVLICANMDSRDWLEKRIPSFKPWPGAKLTIVDLQLPLTARVFFPELTLRYLQPYTLLDSLHKDNPDVGCDKWEFVRSQPLRAGSGARLTFRFDFMSNEVLKSKGYRLKWMSKTIVIKLKKKDARELKMMSHYKSHKNDDDSADSSSEDESPEGPSNSTVTFKEPTQLSGANTYSKLYKDEGAYGCSVKMANISVTAPETWTKDYDALSRTQIKIDGCSRFSNPCVREEETIPTLPIASINTHKEITRTPYFTAQLKNRHEEALKDIQTEFEDFSQKIEEVSDVKTERKNYIGIKTEEIDSNLKDMFLDQKYKDTIKLASNSPWFHYLVQEHKAAIGIAGYPLLEDISNTEESCNLRATEKAEFESVEENYCQTADEVTRQNPPQPDIIDVTRGVSPQLDATYITGDVYPIEDTGNANDHSGEYGMEYRTVSEREKDYPHLRVRSKDRTDFVREGFSFRENVRNDNKVKGHSRIEYNVDYDRANNYSFDSRRDPVSEGRNGIDFKYTDYTGTEARTDHERVRVNTFPKDRTNSDGRGLHHFSNAERADTEQERDNFSLNADQADKEEFDERRIYEREIKYTRPERDNPQNQFVTGLQSKSRQFYDGDRNVYQRTVENFSRTHRGATVQTTRSRMTDRTITGPPSEFHFSRQGTAMFSSEGQPSSSQAFGRTERHSSSRGQYHNNNQFKRARQSRH